MKLNIANKLTLARIVLVPFFAFFIIYPVFTYEHTTWSRIIAAAIFILAAITDFLDGKIARKKQIITHFGKFMDPLADKFNDFGSAYRHLRIGLHHRRRPHGTALAFV